MTAEKQHILGGNIKETQLDLFSLLSRFGIISVAADCKLLYKLKILSTLPVNNGEFNIMILILLHCNNKMGYHG